MDEETKCTTELTWLCKHANFIISHLHNYSESRTTQTHGFNYIATTNNLV